MAAGLLFFSIAGARAQGVAAKVAQMMATQMMARNCVSSSTRQVGGIEKLQGSAEQCRNPGAAAAAGASWYSDK